MGAIGIVEISAIVIVGIVVFGPGRMRGFSKKAGELTKKATNVTQGGLKEINEVKI